MKLSDTKGVGGGPAPTLPKPEPTSSASEKAPIDPASGAVINTKPPNPGEASYWIGSKGIIHNIGVGFIGAFAGQGVAQPVGGVFGSLEDAGIQQLENRK